MVKQKIHIDLRLHIFEINSGISSRFCFGLYTLGLEDDANAPVILRLVDEFN